MIPYEERVKTYTNALIAYGEQRQIVKCREELAECQQVICKVVYGEDNKDHLAEEIADATIMLEQMRIIFNINDEVIRKMDSKIMRLDKKMEEGKPQ